MAYLLFAVMIVCRTFTQSVTDIPFAETDSIPSKPVIFTTSTASDYIIDLLGRDNLWRSHGDTMMHSLQRLIEHFKEPFDSVQSRLISFNYDAIQFKHIDIVKNDTIDLIWLNDSTFIMDTVAIEKEPFILEKTVIKKAINTSALVFENNLPDMESLIDYILLDQDTILKKSIDSVYLESKNIQMYQIINKRVVPPILPPGSHLKFRFLPDSGKIILTETSKAIFADKESPFYRVPNEKMPDSLRIAVNTLLSYTATRDSIQLFINDIHGKRTPIWLSRENDDLYRFWVKNLKNDSITIWMGNPTKFDITLLLEDDINVHRMQKVVADDIPFTLAKPDRTLAKVEPLKPIPVYWNYKLSSSFSMNQTYLSNWAKGENSLSSMLDILGTGQYTNTADKTEWTNSGRLRYGNIIIQKQGLRTTTDIMEFNSQYNKVLKDKIDFSSIFYMKNQVAKGYKYPNDSVVISKFLNPGTFTVGVGFEYKPFKETSLNFSVLSYKNTFVLDTARINQTTHGIAKDKRAKQEMGGQLMIKNRMNIMDDLKVTNSVRLFSGYLNKPENIDVDWEITLDKIINWYFTIRLNLHFIYDDDIRFPVLDKDENPIKLPDGSIKKVPKLQFKEFLGLTLQFKF
ncbi:MAG: DUF3078 domain-containing protein [Bacteroidales bacterium]